MTVAEQIADKEARLADYRTTERDILRAGQSYSINPGGASRSLTRADLPEVQRAIRMLESELARLRRFGSRGPVFRRAVPIDDI